MSTHFLFKLTGIVCPAITYAIYAIEEDNKNMQISTNKLLKHTILTIAVIATTTAFGMDNPSNQQPDTFSKYEMLSHNSSNNTTIVNLFNAAREGDADKIKQLLAESANPRALTQRLQKAPFRRAVMHGHVNIVKLILETATDLEKETMLNAPNKETPGVLHLAVVRGQANIVKAILETVNDDIKKIILSAHDHSPHNSSTPLHLAVMHDHVHIVKIILEAVSNDDKKIILGIQNHALWTPLHSAAMKGHIDTVEALLEGLSSDDKKTILSIQDYWQSTPLHHIAIRNLENLVDAFLSGISDRDKERILSIQDKSQQTPLRIAAQQGFQGCVEHLIQNGADPEANVIPGYTELHHAATRGIMYHTAVRTLLQAGAQIEHTCIESRQSIRPHNPLSRKKSDTSWNLFR